MASEEFLELVKSALQAALETLPQGSLCNKIGLHDAQGPIPIVKNLFIPPDSDGALPINLEDIMPTCSFLAPVSICAPKISCLLCIWLCLVVPRYSSLLYVLMSNYIFTN